MISYNSMQVKNTTNCVTTPRTDCKYVKWEECREEPVTMCEAELVHVPTQENGWNHVALSFSGIPRHFK